MEKLTQIFNNGSNELLWKISIAAGILIAALIIDIICRKVIIPTIRKVTSKTESSLDDHLFNDQVLKNLCRLIPPIAAYAMFQYAFPEEGTWIIITKKIFGIYI